MKFRNAQTNDLHQLISLLADDALGAMREDNSLPINQNYLAAFNAIDKDPNNELIVIEANKKIIGLLQLTYIPYLTYQGSWRCLVEGVRVDKAYRGKGLGKKMFEWAIERAKKKSCRLIQLTSDKQRVDAILFYESLGFIASHEGFKLKL